MVLCLVGGRLDARRDVRPRAVVQRLLLRPEQVRVRVLVEVRRELRLRIESRLANAS